MILIAYRIPGHSAACANYRPIGPTWICRDATSILTLSVVAAPRCCWHPEASGWTTMSEVDGVVFARLMTIPYLVESRFLRRLSFKACLSESAATKYGCFYGCGSICTCCNDAKGVQEGAKVFVQQLCQPQWSLKVDDMAF